MVTFHHDTLSNGLEVILERSNQAHAVAAGFFVKTGSRDESPEVAGVSHFLEHMVFKGTPTRDAIRVNRDFDRIGAKHNAMTSEEDTVFYAGVLPEYLGSATEILADILRPRLDETDFETEKQVILEEIHMYNDNPMMVAYEAAKAAHFGNHPLGGSVLGTLKSVGDLKIEQMRAYFDARYGASNLLLVATGNAEWNQFRDLAERLCGSWNKGTASRSSSPHRGVGELVVINRVDDHQATLITVADAPPLEDDDRYSAALLATILGDHSGSRLYWDLIDPGYADAAELSYQDYQGTGAFYSFLSCGPNDAEANLGRLTAAYQKMMAEGPTAEELERAKNKVLAQLVLRSERSMGRMMPVGSHWAYQRTYLSVEDEMRRCSEVTLDSIRRVLEQYPLFPFTVVGVGPDLKLNQS